MLSASLMAGAGSVSSDAARQQVAASPAARPEFEVVSIKPNRDARGPMGAIELTALRELHRPMNGRLRMRATTVTLLVQKAFDVKDFQVQGAPEWTATERFDIDALAGDASVEQTRGMLQAMLADRFALVARRETRTLPVYELVSARGGMKIAPLPEGGCEPVVPGKPFPGTPFGPLVGCGGMRRQIVSPFPDRLDRIDAVGFAMPAFVELLSNEVKRTVIDRTGFTGLFNVRLEFAPDLPGFDTGPASVAPSASVAPGLSIFTALQEQLGLRLASAHGPVEVLVVERVDRPSGN
jgi:uncharacterized protein (TIGR03435 family)